MMKRNLFLVALIAGAVLLACHRPPAPPEVPSPVATRPADPDLSPSKIAAASEGEKTRKPAPAPRPQDGKGPLKVGVVNLKTCFEKYERIEKVKEELKALGDEYASELNRLQDRMKTLEAQLTAADKQQRLYWKILGDLKLTENELKFQREFGRQRYINRYTELQVIVYNDIRKVVDIVGKDMHYDLILRIEEPKLEEEDIHTASQSISARVVFYHSDALDITDTIIKRLNEEWKKIQASDANAEWDCPTCKQKVKGPTCPKCNTKKP